MNHILAVCDSETEYAYQLVDYLSNKKGFPFLIQLFTSPQKLKEYVLHHPVSVTLIGEKDFSEDIKELPLGKLLILREEGEKEIRDVTFLDKYQSCEQMIKELMDLVMKEELLGRRKTNTKELKLIGVYSPVGRCMKTSFAFVLGQLLSKKHKVLYLNLESYSGLGRLLQREFTADMAELIYYLQNSKDKFIYRMGSLTQQVGEMDILPPFDSFLDFVSVSRDEWIQLFQEIETGSDYEYLILDLSDAVQGLFDILRLCDVVYTLSRRDGFAMAKIAQYEEVLKKSNYEDIWKKTKHCTIPVIKNLPPGLLQLTYTELAQIVREKIEEDLE